VRLVLAGNSDFFHFFHVPFCDTRIVGEEYNGLDWFGACECWRACFAHDWHVGVLALLLNTHRDLFETQFPWVKKVWVVGAALAFQVRFWNS
jgi:hypothetical protein